MPTRPYWTTKGKDGKTIYWRSKKDGGRVQVSFETATGYAKWELMPPELWFLAMTNLPVEDILNLCRTSKEFRWYCEDNVFWKLLLDRDFGIKWVGEGAKEEYISQSRFEPMVSCGSDFTGFVTKDKTLYMWGVSQYGQLGRVKSSDEDSMLADEDPMFGVPLDPFAPMFAYEDHTFAAPKQLGKVQSKPPPTMEGIVQVSCGASHTGSITDEGSLYMWGRNHDGQLGDGTKITKDKPTYVKIKGQIIEVSCGGYHTGAITAEGKLYMWGYNSNGQVGDGTTIDKSKPVLIKIKGNPRFVEVSCGQYHTGAVTADGNLYMWGKNRSYELGDGTQINRNKPVFIMEGVTQVSCGNSHNGAITAKGKLYMWGQNSYGQLGDGTESETLKPTLVKIKGNPLVVQVSCGQDFTGVVTEDSSLYMWGINNYGQLGNGTKIKKNKPIFIMEDIFEVSCGRFHTGAITEDSELYMWGQNSSGQLGDGTKTKKLNPTLVNS